MRDYGYEAQQAAEKRLALLWELESIAEEGGEPEWPADLDPELEAPFCGCTTCEVREVLVAAWPILLEAAREETKSQA